MKKVVGLVLIGALLRTLWWGWKEASIGSNGHSWPSSKRAVGCVAQLSQKIRKRFLQSGRTLVADIRVSGPEPPALLFGMGA